MFEKFGKRNIILFLVMVLLYNYQVATVRINTILNMYHMRQIKDLSLNFSLHSISKDKNNLFDCSFFKKLESKLSLQLGFIAKVQY